MKTSSPVRKTLCPLWFLPLPPSVSALRKRGRISLLASQSSTIFVQDSCFVVIAWFGLPRPRAIELSDVFSEKGWVVFSHTLLGRFQFHEAYLRTGKTSTLHYCKHKHIGCATNTHTRSYYTSQKVQSWHYSGQFGDFLKSSGSPRSPVTTTSHPVSSHCVSIARKRTNPNNSVHEWKAVVIHTSVYHEWCY